MVTGAGEDTYSFSEDTNKGLIEVWFSLLLK